MGNSHENQISSSQYFLKPSWLCVAIFVSSLVFTCFLLFGIFTCLVTVSVLFLSTIFIVTFSKKKVTVVGNSAEDESPICRPHSTLEKEVVEELNPEVEPIIHCDASQQRDVCDMHEYQVEPTDFPSDCDSSNDFSASESFELSLRCSEKVGQSIAVSESSVSEDDDDEDSDGDGLIEISLPQNNSVDFTEESKKKSDSDLSDYLPESIFRQQGLMELFAEINEVNEEENLIEIDLSMGSIKCSRFEIEA